MVSANSYGSEIQSRSVEELTALLSLVAGREKLVSAPLSGAFPSQLLGEMTRLDTHFSAFWAEDSVGL